jgi:hypothetical protein
MGAEKSKQNRKTLAAVPTKNNLELWTTPANALLSVVCAFKAAWILGGKLINHSLSPKILVCVTDHFPNV